MDSIHLLALFAENKIGQLARVTSLLTEANINIRWVTTTGTGTFGVMKLLVDDEEVAFRQLKQHGVPVTLVPVLAILVEDKPGGLCAAATFLAQNHLNVENASGYTAKGQAVLLIEVNEVSRAIEVLQSQGLKLLTSQELRQL